VTIAPDIGIEILQFKSKEAAARFLNVASKSIRDHIDK
jgi:hypothetical protein